MKEEGGYFNNIKNMDRLLYFGNGLTSIKEDRGGFIKPNKALKMVFGVRSISVYSQFFVGSLL